MFCCRYFCCTVVVESNHSLHRRLSYLQLLLRPRRQVLPLHHLLRSNLRMRHIAFQTAMWFQNTHMQAWFIQADWLAYSRKEVSA